MRKGKKHKCTKCTDNRKRKLYYYYPLPNEEGPYHNPWIGELRCKKHAPDPLPWERDEATTSAV